ncbi:MAG: SPOR domain-containing protein, partial [Desulfobacterales bacterium]|nr:SPOR domain-containing protein [Desulfobacterales bacterium]
MNLSEYRRKWLINVCGILLVLASWICFPALGLSSGQERFYTIHVASFQSKNGAVSDVNRFRAMGQDAFYRQSEVPGKGTWYRVYIGRFAGKSEAHQHGEELKSKAALTYYSIQKFDAPSRESKPVHSQAVVKPEQIPASEPALPDSGIQENISP